MKMRKQWRPVSQQEIADLEKFLKASFPDDYKQFLLQSNGGQPVEGYYPSDGRLDWIGGFTIESFYSVPTEEDRYTLSDVYVSMMDRIPKSLLAVGRDGGTNKVCLGVQNDEHFGKVYIYWADLDEGVDEDEDENAPPDFSSFEFLEDSFTAFASKLSPEP